MRQASTNLSIFHATERDAPTQSRKFRVVPSPERLTVSEVLDRYDPKLGDHDRSGGRLGISLMPVWWLMVGIGRQSLRMLLLHSERYWQHIWARYRYIVGATGGLPKYLVDLVIAATTLVLLLPLLIVVAAIIRINLGGPIIFAHTRLGRDGREFSCYKFRSMVNDGDAVLARHLAKNSAAAREWAEHQKLRDDPRVTRLGRMLRKTSIDELPQLVNVIKGDMSCVGPRPIVRKEMAKYGRHVHDYMRARPGLTGLWQVSGRTSVSYERRVALDTYYVRRWSMLLDFSILLRTLPAVIKTDDTA